MFIVCDRQVEWSLLTVTSAAVALDAGCFGGCTGGCVSECQAKQILVGIDMYPYAVMHNANVAACCSPLSLHSLHQHINSKLLHI